MKKLLYALPLLAACHQAPIQSLQEPEGRTREGLAYKVLPGSDTQLHIFLDHHPTARDDRRSSVIQCQADIYMKLQELHDTNNLGAVYFESEWMGQDLRDGADRNPFIRQGSYTREQFEELLATYTPIVRLFVQTHYDSDTFMGGFESFDFMDGDTLANARNNLKEVRKLVENGDLSEDSPALTTAQDEYNRAARLFSLEAVLRTTAAYKNSTEQFETLKNPSADSYAMVIGAEHMHLVPPKFENLEHFIASQEGHPTTTFYACNPERLEKPSQNGENMMSIVKAFSP